MQFLMFSIFFVIHHHPLFSSFASIFYWTTTIKFDQVLSCFLLNSLSIWDDSLTFVVVILRIWLKSTFMFYLFQLRLHLCYTIFKCKWMYLDLRCNKLGLWSWRRVLSTCFASFAIIVVSTKHSEIDLMAK